MHRAIALALTLLALAPAGVASAQDAPPAPRPATDSDSSSATDTPPPADTEAPPPSSDAKSDHSEEFETSWFGIRGEVWYQPTLSLQAKVGGVSAGGFSLVPDNTVIDASKDLGVLTHTPKPTYLDFAGGPLGLEMFVDTRWVSISLWGVSPFEYHGSSVVTETFAFGGVVFSLSRPIETDLAQAIGGLDIKVNIINNRWVRLSPILAARALAIDWTVKDVGQPPIPGASVSTENIDFPFTVGKYKVLPYPEVGGEVRVGYRDIVELDAKLTGMYVNYLGVQATTALVDVGLTGYVPFVPQIGARLGFRYYYVNARTSDQSASKQFDGELRIYGLTFSIIARF